MTGDVRIAGLLLAVALLSACGSGGEPTAAPSPTVHEPAVPERAVLDRTVSVVCGIPVEDLLMNYDLSGMDNEVVVVVFDIGDTGGHAIASHFDKASEADVAQPWQITCPGVERRFTRAEFSAILGEDGSDAAAPEEPSQVEPPLDEEDIYEEPHPGIAAAGGDFECTEPAADTSDEQAALCLHRAWVFYDSGLASEYASDEAVATLFAEPWDGETEWAFTGCEAFASAAVCSWDVSNGTTAVMRLGSRESGSYIESVRFDGP